MSQFFSHSVPTNTWRPCSDVTDFTQQTNIQKAHEQIVEHFTCSQRCTVN